jgi:HSP20 family protein
MKGTVQTEPRRTSDGRAEQEYVSPDVNIVETKDGYVLEAEMPGVSKEGLEVTLEGNEMTIVGHRQDEAVTGTPLFRERKLVDFRRVFELDPTIDTARIAAKMDQGVLSLTLPKSEKVKPRKVTVD